MYSFLLIRRRINKLLFHTESHSFAFSVKDHNYIIWCPIQNVRKLIKMYCIKELMLVLHANHYIYLDVTVAIQLL